MIETVTVDLEGMGIGDSVTIADLDIAKNDAIELLIELDSPVVNIVDQRVSTKRPAMLKRAKMLRLRMQLLKSKPSVIQL